MKKGIPEFMRNANNVYRTKNFIVKQEIAIGCDSVGMSAVLSRDTFYAPCFSRPIVTLCSERSNFYSFVAYKTRFGNSKTNKIIKRKTQGAERERGTQDGKKKKQKYYLCNRKIYNRRFSTDCFSDYFNEQARKTKVGLNDYAEYSAVKATVAKYVEPFVFAKKMEVCRRLGKISRKEAVAFSRSVLYPRRNNAGRTNRG